jgi:surface antigen
MVRDDVLAATGGTQRPFVSASITGTAVYLVQKTPAETATAASAASPGMALSAHDSANAETGRPGRSLAPVAGSSPLAVPTNAPANEAVPELPLPSSAPIQRSEAELAYVPPATTEPSLPDLPPRPALPAEGYPDCRESHQAYEMPFDRADDINECTVKLDKYYSEVLTPFREQMIEYQKSLSQLYVNNVGGNMKYSPKSQAAFYEMMMKEHANSDPQGVNLSAYRSAEERYQEDRAYLQDRFCFNTGCGGYPVPEFDVEKALAQPKLKMDRSAGATGDAMELASASDQPKKKKKKKKSDSKSCKGARAGGGMLGGLLGGVIGDAAGLGKVGTLIAGGLGAVLGAEIACQLDEKEQEKAAEATMTIVEKEEVGAVAKWQSPTRADVSGSSMITALTAEPDGRRCLSITDVAIIDGEETKIAKQMCRGAGEKNYTLMA